MSHTRRTTARYDYDVKYNHKRNRGKNIARKNDDKRNRDLDMLPEEEMEGVAWTPPTEAETTLQGIVVPV